MKDLVPRLQHYLSAFSPRLRYSEIQSIPHSLQGLSLPIILNLRLEAISSTMIPLVPPVRTLISCTSLHLFLALWKYIIIVYQLPQLFNVPYYPLLSKVELNFQEALVSYL